MADTALAPRSELAQSDTAFAKRKPGQRGKQLTPAEVSDVLRWHAQGLTQEQIAARFYPPRSQSTISDCLAHFGTDRTAEAKAILRAEAAAMALNISRRGKPKDHVAALKGLSVLHEEQSSGVTVIVGGGGTVNIGVLSPAKVGVESERLEK